MYVRFLCCHVSPVKCAFYGKIDWKKIVLLSFWNLLGNEFLVPVMVKCGQSKGWISKK